MTKKEFEIQKALGLLNTYSGYVKVHGSDYYDIYEVQDVTKSGARKQLDKIVEVAQKKSKVYLTLEFVVDEMEYPYDPRICSNPKS